MRTLETHVLPGHNRVLSTRHTAPAAGCLNISCLKISYFADRWRAMSGRAFFFSLTSKLLISPRPQGRLQTDWGISPRASMLPPVFQRALSTCRSRRETVKQYVSYLWRHANNAITSIMSSLLGKKYFTRWYNSVIKIHVYVLLAKERKRDRPTRLDLPENNVNRFFKMFKRILKFLMGFQSFQTTSSSTYPSTLFSLFYVIAL